MSKNTKKHSIGTPNFQYFKGQILSQKGYAIAFSLAVVGFLLFACLSASALILSSYKSSRNVERYNKALLISEGGYEMALFEANGGHSGGFDVSDESYSLDDSHGSWSVSSLESMKSAIDNGGKIVLPKQDNIDEADWDTWEETSFGNSKVIKLYSDNTFCGADDDCG